MVFKSDIMVFVRGNMVFKSDIMVFVSDIMVFASDIMVFKSDNIEFKSDLRVTSPCSLHNTLFFLLLLRHKDVMFRCIFY